MNFNTWWIFGWNLKTFTTDPCWIFLDTKIWGSSRRTLVESLWTLKDEDLLDRLLLNLFGHQNLRIFTTVLCWHFLDTKVWGPSWRTLVETFWTLKDEDLHNGPLLNLSGHRNLRTITTGACWIFLAKKIWGPSGWPLLNTIEMTQNKKELCLIRGVSARIRLLTTPHI